MISTSDQKLHIDLMKERFEQALPPDPLGAVYPPYAPNILRYFKDHLDLILGGKPEELIQIVHHVKRVFPEFHKQSRRVRSGDAWKAHVSDAAIVNLVEDCFDYAEFSKKSATWCAYSLVEALGGRICPYCHLHHINYHMPSGMKGFSLRPPLDHFLPKSRYPYLAVSIGNLVPCCSQCNSSVKIAMDPLEAGVLHPRSDALQDRMAFSAKGSIPTRMGGTSGSVKLTVYSSDSAVKNHISSFRLNERYAWYAREVHDLMSNYDRFLEYPEVVKRIVVRSEFVLGFPLAQANDRALGHCLVDVLGELEKGEIA